MVGLFNDALINSRILSIECKDIKRSGSGLICTFREVLWKAINKNSDKKAALPAEM
jgi:hypothetical protein